MIPVRHFESILRTQSFNDKLPHTVVQGSQDTEIEFTVHQDGKKIEIDPSTQMELAILYNGNSNQTYYIQSTDPEFPVTINDLNKTLTIYFTEMLTTVFGVHKLFLKIKDTHISYALQTQYEVIKNEAYNPKSTPNNLPSYNNIVAQLETKLNKDYSNSNDIALKNKLSSMGINVDETPAQIRDKLQTLTNNDRLDASAIKNLPHNGNEITPEQVRDKLASLAGDNRLDVSAVKNAASTDLSNVDGSTIVGKLEALTGENRLSASAIKDMPNPQSNTTIKVAQQEGSPEYKASKLLFPFNTVINDNGTVTVNTSFVVTDENAEIVPDCSIIEVPTTSLLSAVQNVGNSNAVTIDFKGLKADSDNIPIMSDMKSIGLPTDGLLEGEVDPTDTNKLLVSFSGLPTRKTSSTIVRKAMELRFPESKVSGTTGGIVTVGTGHSVSLGDNEISASINSWVIPDNSGLNVEIDSRNPNGIILTNTAMQGISVTNDDTQPINQTTVTYFPQARIDDGSTTGSKVIKTSIPVKSGTDDFDDYKKINFENNDFIVTRDSGDNDMLDVKFSGVSVESGNNESPHIKLFNFSDTDFNVTSPEENRVDISTKTKYNNGFMAVHTHRQVIASDNTQEIYRLSTVKPNSIIWQDEAVNYDPTSGIVTLKYSGSNGEKQLFKVISRATVRRQLREADLGVYMYLWNTSTNDYLTDINGETPIVNTNVAKELFADFIELATIIEITEDTNFKVMLKDDSPNKFVDILDLVMGTSAIVVEKINANNQNSNAVRDYEILTQQSMRFIKHEYNQSFENALNLINVTPNTTQTFPDDTLTQQDGWLVYYQDEGVFKRNTTPDGTADCLQMNDKDSGFGYFNITRVLDYEDTWLLRGKEVKATVNRVEQSGEFEIVPVVWRRRINEYDPKIITNMNNNSEFSTADGWEVISASKTIIAAPTPAETTASFTCAYTVPDDAINLGFMLMPTKQQEHSVIKFTDFSIGCDPTLERWVIEYPEQAVEEQLKKDSKYIKFLPESTTAYNMSQWYQIPNGTPGDNNYSPLYTGEAQAGGNADVTRIYNSASSDFTELHNKGKFRFGKDGRVSIHSKVYVGTDKFADGSDHNTFRLGYIKDNGSGDILQGTPVTSSLRELSIPKSGNVWNDSVRTGAFANWTFTMDVKENDEFWIACNPTGVPREAGNEGHIYSYPNGLIEFTFLENDYAINVLQNQLVEIQKLLKATPEAISNKVYVELGYDSTQSKPTLEAKTEV